MQGSRADIQLLYSQQHLAETKRGIAHGNANTRVLYENLGIWLRRYKKPA
jgi:hypothetical protein